MDEAVHNTEVLHALFRCSSLQSLLDTARKALRSPLILADITCHVLAVTDDPEIADSRFRQIVEQRSLPLNVLNLELYQTSMRTGAPVLSTDHTGLPVVRCAVADGGRLIGYLLYPCHGGAPGEGELDLLRVVTDFCCLRMQKEFHYADYPENILEFFIADLLNGTMTDEDAILDRCRSFRWTPRLPYRVLSVRPAPDDLRSRDGGGYPWLDSGRRLLQDRLPEATVFPFGSQLKVVLPVSDQPPLDELAMDEISAFLAEHGLLAGVSHPAYRMRSLASRNGQAEKALELGLLLRGQENLFFYEKYSIYHCLELCAGQVNLVQCCHSAIIKLEAYDRKQGTELMETLHAYLSCHKSLGEAASSLHIHRNTLTKRLEKINDLATLDLEDNETVFHLNLSFRIMEYYGATAMRDTYENWLEKSPTLRHP